MKPRIDISDSPSRWTMGKRVAEALEGLDENRFLSDFNALATEGSDDEVINCLLKWADLVIDGDVISGDESATVEEVEEPGTEIVVADDPKQLATDATDYLGAIATLDVEDEGYAKVVGWLADVKDMLGKIDDKRKDLTRGARETVEKINAEFAPAIKTYTKAEELLKGKLVEFRSDVVSIRGRMLEAGEEPIEPVPEVEGVILRKSYEIRIVELADVPRAYLVPDMKAIRKAVKAGKSIPGVVSDEVETLAVEHKKVAR